MEENRRLQAMNGQDPLTGVLNRRGFDQRFWKHISNRDRLITDPNGSCLVTAAVIDIDDFAAINNTFGHRAGDRALLGLADLMQRFFRETDIVARFGGDEFVVILFGATAEQARSRFEELLASLNGPDARHLEMQNGQCLQLSIGISVRRLGTRLSKTALESLRDNLIATADIEVYRSKRLGKNRISMDQLNAEAVLDLPKAEVVSITDERHTAPGKQLSGAKPVKG
jgi:diguanylate cyclase (GGDEF)-like protein